MCILLYREEENGAVPGIKSSGSRSSFSAQHKSHCKKQLHYYTNAGTVRALSLKVNYLSWDNLLLAGVQRGSWSS